MLADSRLRAALLPLARARAELGRMVKPREIEGVLDTYLIRPTGYVFVQLLRRTPVTPNMVSVAAMLAGIGVGLSYLFDDRGVAGAWLGLLAMWLHSGLDAADGQLARVTGRTSPLGRIIDGLCDNVTFVSIYVCLVLAHALRPGPWPLAVLGLAVLAGISHSTHCALTEYQRMLYLTYCRGTHDTRTERPELLAASLAEARRRAGAGLGPGLVRRVLLRLQLNYSLQQRTLLGSSDRLERAWSRALERRPELREEFARDFHETMVLPLRFWALLGPNSHKVALVLSAFVAAMAAPGWLRELGMLTYLAYDLVLLNAFMAIMIVVQRRLDRGLERRLEERLDRQARSAS